MTTQESHIIDMAEHLVATHVTRKHDGIIFAGLSEGYEQLLKSIELRDQGGNSQEKNFLENVLENFLDIQF